MLAFAQPIFDLRTGEQFSRELLARLQMPEDAEEIWLPARFLPAAERYELVQAIDVWMVLQALPLAVTARVQVNVSAVTMCDSVARATIADLLAKSPDGAKGIVFEVTETANPEYLEATRDFGHAVTSAGAKLALDDFGVGFGSLNYLRTLPLSFIKIDRSFVRRLAYSDDRRVVQSVIGIAREFGLKTIAEGIEDEETRDLVRELGADYAQGYLLGRPEPL